MTGSGSPKPDQSVRAAPPSLDRAVSISASKAFGIGIGSKALTRARRNEQEPHRLAGSLAGIAELYRVAKHVPVGGEMRAHKGLAQYMFPFERLPRSGFISDPA